MPGLRQRDLRQPETRPARPARPVPQARPTSITDADRRVLGAWAADCAERALPFFEAAAPTDDRPRAAIDGIRSFARGELRVGQVRPLALAAYAAAREVDDPAAAAAARAAGSAAAVAMTHRTVTTLGTAEHALGPVAYAALAWERATGDASAAAAGEMAWAIRRASPAVRAVARRIPAGRSARGRLGQLIREIHTGLGGPAAGGA